MISMYITELRGVTVERVWHVVMFEVAWKLLPGIDRQQI